MKETKGIVLAGGRGTRLYPMTAIASKQLLTIYDKPMIYYPLSTLMLAGIKEILLISTADDISLYEKLLGDGSKFGISIEYKIQEYPRGLPEAFIIGEEFIGQSQVCLILGDNLFYGKLDFLRNALENNSGASIFAYQVEDPSNYGVINYGVDNQIISIEEKPKNPESNYAIPGLYIFDSNVSTIAKNLVPSKRGELEITDLHKFYLEKKQLVVSQIGRGIVWLDTGTPANILEAANFIHVIEKRQGMKIACLEEVALNQGYINNEEFISLINNLPECSYKEYGLKIWNYIENGK